MPTHRLHVLHRYSYVATLPLLVLFSVAMTTLKFKEGVYVFHPMRLALIWRQGFLQVPTGQSSFLIPKYLSPILNLSLSSFSYTSATDLLGAQQQALVAATLLRPQHCMVTGTVRSFFSQYDQWSLISIRVTHLEGTLEEESCNITLIS